MTRLDVYVREGPTTAIKDVANLFVSVQMLLKEAFDFLLILWQLVG